jgi:hypothetical protein
MDAPLDRQRAAWDTIRACLRSERDRILEEIRAYPTPIPRCDQQFNYLLERRERLFQELARLDGAERSSAVATDVAARIEEFIDSMHYLDDGARLRLKSASSKGLVKPEL